MLVKAVRILLELLFSEFGEDGGGVGVLFRDDESYVGGNSAS